MLNTTLIVQLVSIPKATKIDAESTLPYINLDYLNIVHRSGRNVQLKIRNCTIDDHTITCQVDSPTLKNENSLRVPHDLSDTDGLTISLNGTFTDRVSNNFYFGDAHVLIGHDITASVHITENAINNDVLNQIEQRLKDVKCITDAGYYAVTYVKRSEVGKTYCDTFAFDSTTPPGDGSIAVPLKTMIANCLLGRSLPGMDVLKVGEHTKIQLLNYIK
ncbi:hypothetical protein AB6D11_02630 [Vibrio splendidus]